VFTDAAMGELTEKTNQKLGISREDQDAFSAQSHQRAALATKNGLFDDEIATVEIPQRKGDPLQFRED
jgi:acetyl-CoA C-acetyltransferase